MRKILVTGGSGYIGSHTCVALAAAGYEPVVLDKTNRQNDGVLRRMQYLMGRPFAFEHTDLQDVKALREVLERHRPDAVIHLAGDEVLRSSKQEEMRKTRTEALDNYIWAGFCLVQAMEDAGCRHLLTASSDTVYHQPYLGRLRESSPLSEDHPVGVTHRALEDLYQSIHAANKEWKIGVVRLFEVVGAHHSLMLGPPVAGGSPNWLMELSHVAGGLLPHACVQGFDHATDDGTPVRDYVHVQDVAEGLVAGLRTLDTYNEGFVVNLGTGNGYSRIEALLAFEAAVGRSLLFRFVNRAPEDAPHSVADTSLAQQLLGWKPTRSFVTMCKDTWGWHEAYLQRVMPDRRPPPPLDRTTQGAATQG
jgi:UDP-glucose 4-epimerase